MPTDLGTPDSTEFARMGNTIARGGNFDDAVKEYGFPNTPVFRTAFEKLKTGITKAAAEGKQIEWSFD